MLSACAASVCEDVVVGCACCGADAFARTYNAIAYCQACTQYLCADAPRECMHFIGCEVCFERHAVAETRWVQGRGRVTVRERCQSCIDRAQRRGRAFAAARKGVFLTHELAELVGVQIAVRVAREGRELARCRREPNAYPMHVLAQIRAEEGV